MKIMMEKLAGGNFIPANDFEAEKLTKIKTGDMVEVSITKKRNPRFHRKAFALFNFCFEYWRGTNEFQDESKQFDTFRANLLVLAGFYDQLYKIDGSMRIEAKSLKFSQMSDEEFDKCYQAVVRAACKHIFHSADERTYNRLITMF